MNQQNERLRNTSGKIDLQGRLTSFLYVLMRDHMPIGEIEKMVREIENEGDSINSYSNGWLALYAEYLSKILQGDK